jgi:regulator of ribonuclease activity A
MQPSTAELMDQRGADLNSCELQMRQYGRRLHWDGRVRTVRCYEDFGLVRRVLEEPGFGMVLVVDGGGSLRSALLGDRLAGSAERGGWAGIVIAGAVRDVGALAGVDIGIKALGSSPRRSADDGVGDIDVPVTLGSATFNPGEYLWSDEDGVVVSRR